jgi:hypothetical protein
MSRGQKGEKKVAPEDTPFLARGTRRPHRTIHVAQCLKRWNRRGNANKIDKENAIVKTPVIRKSNTSIKHATSFAGFCVADG